MDGVDGNLVGVANPGLAPLGNYGGPTQTIALLPGSPAIDAGTSVPAPPRPTSAASRVVGGRRHRRLREPGIYDEGCRRQYAAVGGDRHGVRQRARGEPEGQQPGRARGRGVVTYVINPAAMAPR